jgi:hypothetical protein
MSKAALSTGSNVNGSLKWEVFVAPGIPAAASDLPPGTKQGMWSPISSTPARAFLSLLLQSMPRPPRC